MLIYPSFQDLFQTMLILIVLMNIQSTLFFWPCGMVDVSVLAYYLCYLLINVYLEECNRS